MPWSRPIPWVRLAAVALLGVLAVAASPRPAVASGCHLDERPRIGLSTLGGRDDPSAERADGRVAPRPCSGDSSASDAGPSTTAAMPAARFVLPQFLRTPGPRSRPVGDREIGATLWDDRSRPPRAPSFPS